MEIKQSNIVDGKGLFVTNSHTKGEVIYTLRGTVDTKPCRESIYIGGGEHIYDEYGIFMNHSFQPNTEISGKNIVALNTINSGDEITFDYNSNEIIMAAPFVIDGVHVIGKNY